MQFSRRKDDKIEMITQKEDEPRIEYLVRVLHHFMQDTIAGEETIEYDGVLCDGACLADDIADVLGISVE